MLCENTSNTTQRFEIATRPGRPPLRFEVAPGQTVDIPDGYCREYISSTRRKSKPIIQQICAAMKPTGRYAPGTMPPQSASEVSDTSQAVAQLVDMNRQLLQQMAVLQADVRDSRERQDQLEADLAAARLHQPVSVDEDLGEATRAVDRDQSDETPDLSGLSDEELDAALSGDSDGPRAEAVAELMALPRAELVKKAKAAGIKGATQLNKPDLAEALA